MNTRCAARRAAPLFVAFACGLAGAQEGAPEPATALAQATLERMLLPDDEFDPGAWHETAATRQIKGAPFCAEAVHETVQWLPDGAGAAPNRIVRQQVSRICRDGEGRTRQEVERGKRRLVYLRDPVARETWVLDVERKTARRIGDRMLPLLGGERPPLSGGSNVDGDTWRDFAERMKEWARGVSDRALAGGGSGPVPPAPPVPPTPAVPPNAGASPARPVIITRSEGGPGAATELRLLRLDRDADPDLPAPPAGLLWRAEAGSPRGAGATTPLPARDIEGLRAVGERTTWVIEAGKVGNEKPIQILREVWSSPDLMVTLSSRDFDPRSGETNYRLRNLRRGEPDPALMRVPADFSRPQRAAPRASG